jgi:hypothetical protein
MGPNQSDRSTRQHVLWGRIDRRLHSERREWGAKRSTMKHAPSSRSAVCFNTGRGIRSPPGSNSGDAWGRRPQPDTVMECSIKNNEIVKTTPSRIKELGPGRARSSAGRATRDQEFGNAPLGLGGGERRRLSRREGFVDLRDPAYPRVFTRPSTNRPPRQERHASRFVCCRPFVGAVRHHGGYRLLVTGQLIQVASG